MIICNNCGLDIAQDEQFCRNCGAQAVFRPVMPAVPPPPGPVVSSPPRQSQAPLIAIFFAAALGVIGVSAYVLTRDNTPVENRVTVSTPAPPADTPTPAPAYVPPPPTESRRAAISYYNGVNVRSEPSKNARLLTTINKGRRVWILSESGNYETNYIKSAGRNFTDNWSEVELAGSGVHGWIWSAFLKP